MLDLAAATELISTHLQKHLRVADTFSITAEALLGLPRKLMTGSRQNMKLIIALRYICKQSFIHANCKRRFRNKCTITTSLK